jgi:hypothetical protein
MVGATGVLIAFVASAGWVVQRAHEDSVRTARFAQLQVTVYLLLAGAELDERGALVLPPSFPEHVCRCRGQTSTQRSSTWCGARFGNLPPA